MAAKACVACGKLIAEAYTVCAFCKAAQPASAPAPPASKETRCPTCRRPYATRLAACPHCERDKSSGRRLGGGAAVAGSSGGATSSSSLPILPSAVDGETENRAAANAISLGGPLLLGAIVGAAEAVHAKPLALTSGLLAPSIAAGLLLSLLLGLLFLRRGHGTLRRAFVEAGPLRFVGLAAVVTAVGLVPAALSVYGLLSFANGLGIRGREREVACMASEPVHDTKADTDLGWSLAYRCELDGALVSGSLKNLPIPPDRGPDGEVRLRVARGRLGVWLRRSDPLPIDHLPRVHD